MTNEPKAMREIHEIRERIYKETKGMTAEEHTAYYKKRADAATKKYGLTLCTTRDRIAFSP